MNKFTNVGICVGASTISVVNTNSGNTITPIVSYFNSVPHNGNPHQTINKILSEIDADKVTVTGRSIKNRLNIPSVTEAQCIEHSLEYLKITADLVISAGAENFIIYFINKKGKIYKVTSGNKCASGTGEFFIQQLKRMNISLEEAVNYNSASPYNISGRCSVFCKSDCTHALNKGIDKSNIVSGLNTMMADKIVNLIPRYKNKRILLIGGTTHNKGFVNALTTKLPNLFICSQSTYFEALGASLYSYYNDIPNFNYKEVQFDNKATFSFHPPLSKYSNYVTFKEVLTKKPNEGEECILGLDVGSTTTKAVIISVSDNMIIGKVYLRTNGNPIEAAINCYRHLQEEIKCKINIVGLGVTGSGREIAGLHAQTHFVINEIIAHAAATSFFDNAVDTIFEIGGQDAKYTHLTEGTASDYAMNEACSAGTGSFLEEAAEETLKVKYTEIAEYALSANNPPNFNDQCSAFISSDIKNALNEGLKPNDILAGLVYSICQNYINRVKGNRPIGRKIFMQGGVCYNKAVPIAMAALTGKKIIVPPEPGLMGAFGVALEVKSRIELGLYSKQNYSLLNLINTKINYNKSFICAGGNDKCDRKCEITLFEINGKNYPFGGACSLYAGSNDSYKTKKGINYVKIREELVFKKYIKYQNLNSNKTIGILKSFLTNTYYPLFYNFFTSLGFNVILENKQDKQGTEKMTASFCYPVEISHNLIQNILKKKPDYIFIPHIKEFSKSKLDDVEQKACVILQSENYYLKSAFKEELKEIKILSPVISFNNLFDEENGLLKTAVNLGKTLKEAKLALLNAQNIQNKVFSEFKLYGKKFLDDLNNDEVNLGIVVLGRSYNSYVDEANLGIPKKISSKGISIIPHDFLEYEEIENQKHLYWGQGSQIVKVSKIIKNNSKLFAVYITNFSCGPDSFLLSYFRRIMGSKPSLTLELDSHTADAGINTRIEAAIDIFVRYKNINCENVENVLENNKPLKLTEKGEIFDTVNNKYYLLNDERVKIILPSMGVHSSQAMESNFSYFGIKSEVLPKYTYNTLKVGRGNTLCKECLPLQLCTGSLLEYCKNRKSEDEITLYFMSAGNGPCRFGQYTVFLENIIKKNNIPNIGLFTLSDEDGYTGFGTEFFIRGWVAFVIADVMKNIENAIKVLAYNKINALQIFNNEWEKIKTALSKKSLNDVYKQLELTAQVFNNIEKRYSIKQAKKISLIGEIFVRHDEFSRMNLIETLADNDFVVVVAPVSEYVYYSDFLAKRKNRTNNLTDIIYEKFKTFEQKRIESKIKSILAKSDLVEKELVEIEKIIEYASPFLSEELEGEAILTIGSALKEILNHSCGIISLGPFGCMPSRIAESILNVEMNYEGKLISENRMDYITTGYDSLPFLAIETDGNLFPPIIQSKIEIFMLNAERLYFELKNESKEDLSLSIKALIKYVINFYTEKSPPLSLNYDES